MTRALVTGGTGLVGRQVVRALVDAGHEVHATSRRAVTSADDDVTWHDVDLLDDDRRAAFVRDLAPTHVVHAAWHTDPADYRDSAANLDWATTSTSFARELAAVGTRRLVGVGTCFEYDLDAGWCREDATPLSSGSVYGRAKDATRRLLDDVAATSDLAVAWGRVFFTFGPGEDARRVVPHVVTQVLDGATAACSDGRQLRDFLSTRQVGRALAAIVLSDVTGAVNVCSGRPVVLADLLRRAAELAGDPALLDLGARGSSAGEPPLVAGDVTRLHDEVGFTPDATLDDDLAATVDWWREQRRG